MTEYKIDLRDIDPVEMFKELKQAKNEKRITKDDTIIIIGARNPFDYNNSVDKISRWLKIPVNFKEAV